MFSRRIRLSTWEKLSVVAEAFVRSDPYVTREITIRDLLVHRAGLANGD